MNKFSLLLDAQFFLPTAELPSIEDQYRDLWRLAKALEEVGLPLDNWFPTEGTPAQSLLNLAFDKDGVTTAALAITKAKKQRYPNIRSIGVWNGAQEDAQGDPIGVGAGFRTTLEAGPTPSDLSMDMREVEQLRDYRAVLKIVLKIIEIWKAHHVAVAPFAYAAKQVFDSRAGVGWMVYLPLALTTEQVPEAAELIPVYDEDSNKKKIQRGTVVVSVAETFDAKNPEHIQRANAIEIRLADQDLLPTYMELSNKP